MAQSAEPARRPATEVWVNGMVGAIIEEGVAMLDDTEGEEEEVEDEKIMIKSKFLFKFSFQPNDPMKISE